MIPSRIQQKNPLPELARSLTAREALLLVDGLVRSYDKNAWLHRIDADEYIDDDGSSDYWSFLFMLPNEQSRAYFSVGVDHGGFGGRAEGRVLYCDVHASQMAPDGLIARVLRLGHVPPGLVGTTPGNAVQELLAQGTFTTEHWTEFWQNQLAQHPALPLPFVDSPEAMTQLLPQTTPSFWGSTHISLRSTFLPDGQAAWCLASRRTEVHTRLAASLH